MLKDLQTLCLLCLLDADALADCLFPLNVHNEPDVGLHSLGRCSCDAVMATSQACVPLVTCPEAAPLIGALLQRSVACVRADLSEDFLQALSAAYSR